MTSSSDTTEPDEPGIPDGFRRFMAGGPYMRRLGPLYNRPGAGSAIILALRIAHDHLNIQGVAHGGMLTTFADSALGINLGLAHGGRRTHVTISMTADFLSAAREGDWLEAHVALTRLGQRLAYLNCDLKAGERHVMRSSAVFAFVDRPLPPAHGGPVLQDG